MLRDYEEFVRDYNKKFNDDLVVATDDTGFDYISCKLEYYEIRFFISDTCENGYYEVVMPCGSKPIIEEISRLCVDLNIYEIINSLSTFTQKLKKDILEEHKNIYSNAFNIIVLFHKYYDEQTDKEKSIEVVMLKNGQVVATYYDNENEPRVVVQINETLQDWFDFYRDCYFDDYVPKEKMLAIKAQYGLSGDVIDREEVYGE